ncbi:MAG: hypothetical protein M0Z64_03100 [Nitrospiraceae bacterium]|nr:hypothetical protein [Nitrospiraceae bacterium]
MYTLSLHDISFIFRQKRNWQQSLSKNGQLSKWNANCKGNRLNYAGNKRGDGYGFKGH